MPSTKARKSMEWGCWILAFFAVPAYAQTSPGGLNDALKRPAVVQPQPDTPALPQRSANAPPVASERSLQVKAFRFIGNSVFTAEQLQAITRPYLDHPVSLAELYEAADKITALYTSQGYALANAVIPAQDITDGAITIEVLEGKVGKVSFEGLRSYKADSLLTFLPELQGKVYQGQAFERGLRTLDELPGLSGKAQLRPGAMYGSTDIVIKAQERPIEGEVFYDNSGRKNTGERRMGAQVAFNNLSGAGDVLTLLGMRATNDRLQYLYGTYGIPVNQAGMRINLSYGYAKFNLADSITGLSGSNRNARIELAIPTIRSAADRLTLTLGLGNIYANTDLSGIPLNQTRLTLADAGANYGHTWRSRAVSQAAVTLSSNFRSDSSNRNAQLLRIETDLQHLQPLAWGLQALAHINAAYGPERLPDSQQYTLGGPNTIRGYAPSEVRGDWGYFGSATLRWPVGLGRGLVVSPRINADAGTVHTRSNSADRQTSLSSVGLGLDVAYKNLTFRSDYAIPTDGRTTSDGRDDGRFYGALSVNF